MPENPVPDGAQPGSRRARRMRLVGISCTSRRAIGARFAANVSCAQNFTVRAAVMKTYGATSVPVPASRSTTFLMNDWVKKNLVTSSLSVTLVTEPSMVVEPLAGITATGDTYEILLVGDEIVSYAVI